MKTTPGPPGRRASTARRPAPLPFMYSFRRSGVKVRESIKYFSNLQASSHKIADAHLL